MADTVAAVTLSGADFEGWPQFVEGAEATGLQKPPNFEHRIDLVQSPRSGALLHEPARRA